jgi:hypothetical protein
MKLFTSKKAIQDMLYGVIVVLIIVLFNRYIYDGTDYTRSRFNDKEYRVRSGPENQRKADLLAFLEYKFDILINALKNDPKYAHNIDVQRLLSNWSRGISIKEIGNLESEAAYVINKQNMSFCLQDLPSPGENVKTTSTEDTNLITYVGLHELAHVMSNETGHGSEFIKNFEFILDYCKKLNCINPFTNKEEPLYIQLNKINTADNYCGVPLVNSIN